MNTPTQQTGGESATPDLRYLAVDFIEGGTFVGGDEDAYHFDAREKTDFVVIRRSAFDQLATLHAQIATLQKDKEALESFQLEAVHEGDALHAQIARMKQREGELVGALAELEALATGEGWNTPIFSAHFGASIRRSRAALQSVAKEGEQ